MKEKKKPSDVVVLVCSSIHRGHAVQMVSLILTAGAIEVHAMKLDDARRWFLSQGYQRGEERDIHFPTTVPDRVKPQGAAWLEVWVKY